VIRIRKVEREDLETLFTLDRQCFRPGIAYSRAELRDLLSSPTCISVAAENTSSKIVGFAIVEFYVEAGKRIGHIVTIDVAPSARRQGVGRALMGAMLDSLRSHQAILVRLEVAVDNPDAQSFYRQQGFVSTRRISGFYLGTVDALAMQKVLVPINRP
jgi:ribosomal-protein-alanine N-acetyltransferase